MRDATNYPDRELACFSHVPPACAAVAIADDALCGDRCTDMCFELLTVYLRVSTQKYAKACTLYYRVVMGDRTRTS